MTDHTHISLSEETSVAVEVVQALATVTDSSALELPPLYESIDPDALEAVFGRGSSDCLQFRYEGSRVRLSRIDDSTLRLALEEG